MMEKMKQPDFDESEIKLLKEWLPKLSTEYRAFIKGAAKALYYVQEIQHWPVKSNTNDYTEPPESP
jgi:hypothetical protein